MSYILHDVGSGTIAPDYSAPTGPLDVTDWPIEHITDQVNRALARLLSQYKDKQRIRDLLGAFVEEIQLLDTRAFEYIEAHTLDDAPAHLLTAFGEIVGLVKQREGGYDFRTQVRTQIVVNRGSGEIENLIEVIQTLTGASDAEITILDFENMEVRITLAEPMTSEEHARQLNYFLQKAKPAGVRLWIEYLTAAPASSFCFADGLTATTDAGAGWSDVAMSTGGKMAGGF